MMSTPRNCDYLHSSQSHPVMRHWQTQGILNFSVNDFVLPMFLVKDPKANEKIENFPGVHRMGLDVALDYLEPLVNNLGLSSILLFPCLKKNPDEKSIDDAFNSEINPLIVAIPEIRKRFANLLIVTDVCLCGFTEHGHCCLLDEKTHRMDNDKTIVKLAELAVKYAQCGADVVAPSDMMDNRIWTIRQALNGSGFDNVSIMTYGAKFLSCFYGPFRNAAGSAPRFGDRRQYQLPAGSSGMAIRSGKRDIWQGADMIMVKPGMLYLDIIRRMSEQFPDFPIAVYHVSGEYTMTTIAAQQGVFDLRRSVIETMIAFKRSGASVIFTYFTPQILQWLKDGKFSLE